MMVRRREKGRGGVSERRLIEQDGRGVADECVVTGPEVPDLELVGGQGSGSLSMRRVEPKRTARDSSAGPSTSSSSWSVVASATET